MVLLPPGVHPGFEIATLEGDQGASEGVLPLIRASLRKVGLAHHLCLHHLGGVKVAVRGVTPNLGVEGYVSLRFQKCSIQMVPRSPPIKVISRRRLQPKERLRWVP